MSNIEWKNDNTPMILVFRFSGKNIKKRQNSSITEKFPTKLRKSWNPYKDWAGRVLSQIFKKRQNPKNDKTAP